MLTRYANLVVAFRSSHTPIQYGRNALHWAALGGHKNCALWLVSKSKGTTLIHSLTLVNVQSVYVQHQFHHQIQTNKSPSRCAFEAGYAALAAKLQVCFRMCIFQWGADE